MFSILLVLSGSIEYRHDLVGGNVKGIGSYLINQLIDNSGIGEGTSRHNFVITLIESLYFKK
jgi:hypothetical protein